jgi:hypothetical protein
MTWLARLLSIEAPEHSSLRSADVALRGLFPLWLAVILFVLAAALIAWLYLREQVRLRLARRLIMAGLRVAAVGLLLALLLRPMLIVEFVGDQPRPIALLIDVSQSMNQPDQRLTPQDLLRVAIAEDRVSPDTAITEAISMTDVPAGTSTRPARIDLVRHVLTNPRFQLTEGLRPKGPLDVYVFGQRLRQAAGSHDEASLGSTFAHLAATETRTALADSVRELLTKGEASIPAAIVLMTDGRDNASVMAFSDVARDCARLGAPLHIYGVGTPEVGNLALKDMAAPDRIFYDDAVAVPVRWRAQGFKSGTADITLSLGGKVVAQKQVQVRPNEDAREVLTFTPTKRDDGGANSRDESATLVASIKFNGQETFLTDNEIQRPVQLSDRKVRILYVEHTPRWEYKFLMQTLLRDRRVEASVTLTSGDPRALSSGPPYVPNFPATRQELFAFDLVILGDVAATYLTPERVTWIRDFVSEGGGLCVIAGRQHLPASYRSTALGELLPVEVVVKDARTLDKEHSEPFTPVLTRAGQRSEMLTLADSVEENRLIWQQLEPLQWHYPVTKLRPGAVALLIHPGRANGQPMPVLAAQPFGRGNVLFLGTDETWRWRYNARDKYYARFWGQVAYQLGLPHLLGNPKRLQIDLERPEPVLGQPGRVFVRLLDSDYRPLERERVAARLERLDAPPGERRAQNIVLQAVGDQPGQYQALLPHDRLGRFALKLDDPEPGSMEYQVTLPPHHEVAVGGMEEGALREAAQLSGGKYYREEELHQLAADIQPRSARVAQRQEVLLWSPFTLLLFVALVTAEWVARRYANLS